jgi:hypothetical protein
MLVVACPSCGAEIRFQSTVMPVKVCEFCRSLVMRVGDQLALKGEAAVLPDDVSPIRIGMRGEADGAGFTVVGRLRWQWSAGAWNEWLGLCEDGALVWLGEAMGRFMVLREHKGPISLPVRPRFGEKAQVGGHTYKIMDVKTAVHRGAEGELPFAAHVGAALLNIDMADDEGRCASVQTIAGHTSAFTGRFSDLKSLKPSNLRAIPGWPMPPFAHD